MRKNNIILDKQKEKFKYGKGQPKTQKIYKLRWILMSRIVIHTVSKNAAVSVVGKNYKFVKVIKKASRKSKGQYLFMRK